MAREQLFVGMETVSVARSHLTHDTLSIQAHHVSMRY